ncbi:MAG: glycosyltransferase family 8 protein [Atopostipes suicloacalis]|nr:glycosyltransferase family 8 protein [Atopostipes suicloacalis]
MNLVFSFDENYIEVFKVFLYSIYSNHKNEKSIIYFLHDNMEEAQLFELRNEIERYSYIFHSINAQEFFKDSDKMTVNRYYTIEMYLWLFAPYLLPDDVERALYLDPDIINMNSIEKLYKKDFNNHLFIAMDYEVKNKFIQPFNNLRLGTHFADHYFNAGVVLMNIKKLRAERNPEEIIKAVLEKKPLLILPDQDIFNALYNGSIKKESWEKYNMDPRLYQIFQLLDQTNYSDEWIEKELVFIHYAGKNKPWLKRESYKMDLGKYYFAYEKNLADSYKRLDRIKKERI